MQRHVLFVAGVLVQVEPNTFEVVDIEDNEKDLIKQFPKGPVYFTSIGGWSFSRADQVFT